MRVFKGEEVAA